MKHIINRSKIFYWMLPALLMLALVSCKKNEGGTGSPVITRVRLISKTDTIAGVAHPVTLDSSSVYDDVRQVKFDSTVVAGRLSTQYAIVGKNLASTTAVYFNGQSVYFNPALLTDNSIIVTIPATAPFGPTQSNKLTVVTTHGKVDFSFQIMQPPPQLTTFAPLAGAAGDTLTITGTVLDNALSVKFGTVPATIISNTSTQIKVLIPAGVVQAFIFVTTAGGTSETANSFGFKRLIFDDALASGWGGNNGGYTGYNSSLDFNNTAHVKRGTKSVAVTFENSYGALQIGYGGPTINVSTDGLTAIKFSIYGGTGIKTGDQVSLVINGDYGHNYVFTINAGVYTDYTVPLKSVGSPAVITEFVLQGYGVAVPSVMYVDDIGFI
jgi:hypothetical protein